MPLEPAFDVGFFGPALAAVDLADLDLGGLGGFGDLGDLSGRVRSRSRAASSRDGT